MIFSILFSPKPGQCSVSHQGLGPFDHAAAAPAAATLARRDKAELADAAGARLAGAGAAAAAEAPQRGGAGCGGSETWLGGFGLG